MEGGGGILGWIAGAKSWLYNLLYYFAIWLAGRDALFQGVCFGVGFRFRHFSVPACIVQAGDPLWMAEMYIAP